MRIATKMKLPIKHDGKVTDIKPLELDPKNPGFGKPVEYRDIDHRNPQVAQQLRVYRKHGKIRFDELLKCDVDPRVAAERSQVLQGNPAGKNVDRKDAKPKEGGDRKSKGLDSVEKLKARADAKTITKAEKPVKKAGK